MAVAGASAEVLLAAVVGACSAVGRAQKLVVVPEQVDWIEWHYVCIDTVTQQAPTHGNANTVLALGCHARSARTR